MNKSLIQHKGRVEFLFTWQILMPASSSLSPHSQTPDSQANNSKQAMQPAKRDLFAGMALAVAFAVGCSSDTDTRLMSGHCFSSRGVIKCE